MWMPRRSDAGAIARTWLLLAVVIVIAAVGAAVVLQQRLRSAADHPQIELVHAAAGRLAGGQETSRVVPSRSIDIASSPAPFTIVFDRTGRVVAASGELRGRVPGLPGGVLGWVARHGQDRISWQPAPGVREAAVIDRYGGARPGFVLVARSLRRVEARELRTTLGVAGAALAALAAAVFVAARIQARSRAANIGPTRGDSGSIV